MHRHLYSVKFIKLFLQSVLWCASGEPGASHSVWRGCQEVSMLMVLGSILRKEEGGRRLF